MAELNCTSKSVTMRGIRIGERRPMPTASMKPGRFVTDGGEKCSWTNCQTKTPAMASIAPATKNVQRIPTAWAMSPPSTGPAEIPTYTLVCSSPMLQARRSRGTMPATSAVAAAIVPVNMPWRIRRTRNSPTFCTSPMRAMINPPTSIARSTISLRPCRSASAPQIGLKIASETPVLVTSAPDQKTTALSGLTPISLR